jgi:hypothetical protein
MKIIATSDIETTGFLDSGDHRIIEVYVGMWTAPDGSYTWREGDGGPTHWRQTAGEKL